MTAAAIAKALHGRRSGTGWLIRCPAHEDTTPSCSIADGDAGRLLVKCYAGCEGADVLRALRRLGLLDNRSPAADRTHASVPARPRRSGSLADWARRLFGFCTPITPDSVAGKYLIHRGCALPPPDGDLRWHSGLAHRPTGTRWPALVGRITDVETNEPISLHRTFIARDGSGKAPVKPDRLYLKDHRKAGGVIRLWPDADVTLGLLVAEGVETALSGARAYTPAWSCIDSGNLATLPVLGGIESLVILEDDDAAGRRAAEACARRWTEAGREARIWRRA